MKNVKGWKTGTLYGEPIYKTVDKSKLVDPGLNEYYVHSPDKILYDRAYWHKYL
jgi:NADH dehydrogenase (ubiquinone) 1 alpha subcomplex subunit 13